MPIVDVLLVATTGENSPSGLLAQELAQALATVFQAPEGRVWVRLQLLAQHHYAENGVLEHPNPVFVNVLHADLPSQEQLAAQAQALCVAVARCLRCAPERIHIEYAPPGRGRVAFAGKLLR